MALEAGGYEDMAGQTTMKDKDEFSQGNLVQFDKKGNMRIFRMDFHNNAVIGEPLLMGRPVKSGKHLEEYSFARREASNQAPELSSLDVKVESSSVPWKKEPAWISVSFPSGTDDEFVHHYVVTLSRDGETLKEKKILADFYKHPSPEMMKPLWEVAFRPEDFENYEINPGTYTVSLTAVDSWDAESSTLTKEVVVN